jgi:transcriptional regulator with XRE-family HTH domain
MESHIRKLRKSRRWTQQELADAANTTQFTISQIELGHRNPHGETLQRIARALDVPISALFDEESTDPKESAPPGSARAAAGSETEKLALLETYSRGILEIIKELDPANNPLDRVAVDHIKARVLEMSRVLTEKTGDRENPLAARMRHLQETEGVEVEVLGLVEGPAKTSHGSFETPADRPAESKQS